MGEDDYLDSFMESHLSHGYDSYEDDYDPFYGLDPGYDEDEDDPDFF